MNKKDLTKLLKAGFRVIRTQDRTQTTPPLIKILTLKPGAGDPSWITYEKFDTRAARERRMAELLLDDKTVEG